MNNLNRSQTNLPRQKFEFSHSDTENGKMANFNGKKLQQVSPILPFKNTACNKSPNKNGRKMDLL